MFDNLRKKFSGLFSRSSEEFVKKSELETKIIETLVESDVSIEVAERIWKSMEKDLDVEGKKIPVERYISALRNAIIPLFEVQKGLPDILNPREKPYVILFLGINGTGKTTTVAKIASYLRKNGKRVALAASDTFRAGAIEQISILGEKIGVEVIKHQGGSDPSAVAFDAINHARARNIDYVLIDSAGRMQTNKNLIEEMKKIKRISRPNLTVVVLDAMIGQDAVNQAETFFSEVGFDCIIVTKLDTDARGGSILTMVAEVKKPILFVGSGQKMDDLQQFTTEWFLDRILPQ
ncbi:MAG: signal recognition particle-docking protein FtsY [Thermoplasmataceae archaeon]|jgi:fused signal recognition particle receptor